MKQINAELACDKNTASSESSGLINQLRQIDIGAVPIALFITICAIVAISAYANFLPKNMIGGLAVIMTLGFALAQLGKSIPVLRDIGGPAILCLMVPSVLVYFNVFQPNVMGTVHLLMKDANLLYFVIASLVVGSILGMNRVILIQDDSHVRALGGRYGDGGDHRAAGGQAVRFYLLSHLLLHHCADHRRRHRRGDFTAVAGLFGDPRERRRTSTSRSWRRRRCWAISSPS